MKTFNSYYKKKYGVRIQKITVNTGLNCPNRNKNKEGGCIYCFKGSGYSPPVKNLKEHIAQKIKHYSAKNKKQKYMVYFQAYTNSYGDIDKLKKNWDTALSFENVIGISVGTRPDSLSASALEYLARSADKKEIVIELGLQSASDKTLKFIKRGHTVKDFVEAVKSIRARSSKIIICAHLIIGLPTDSGKDYEKAVKLINDLKINAVKFHPLHILKSTELEKMYNDGKIKILTKKEYALKLKKIVKGLNKNTAVWRLTADAPEDFLTAPEWCLPKNKQSFLKDFYAIL